MELRDLVLALLARDALAARQWVADAARMGARWSDMPRPGGLDATGLAVAAGVVEMMAERSGHAPPPWTRSVPAAPTTVVLVRAAETMPRLRRECEENGPAPLRMRHILAPPDFLTAA